MEALSHFSLLSWFLLIIAGVAIGLSKSGFGGFGIIAVLLMAEVLPAKESTGAVLPLLIAADLMAARSFRAHVSWPDFLKLLPMTFLGLLVGWFFMGHISAAIFARVLGWMVLAMMALVIWQRVDRRILPFITNHPLLAGFSGFLAGVTTMIANAGGPAMTFYLLARRLDKMTFVGTTAWFFLVINLCKVPLSWNLGLITKNSLLLNLILLPTVVVGIFLGRRLLGKISQKFFEWMMICMALAAALKLLLR